MRRGGCPTRWYSLANCTHGDSIPDHIEPRWQLPLHGEHGASIMHHTHLLCTDAAATSTETSTSIDTSGLAALTWAELLILGPAAVWAPRGSSSCGPVAAAPSAGCDEVFKGPPDSVRRFSCVRFFGRLVERCEHTVRVRVKIMRSHKCRIAGKSQSGLL